MTSGLLLLAVSAASSAGRVEAQELAPVELGQIRPYRYTAVQTLAADPMATVLADEHVVRMPGRSWIQLELDNVRLGEGSRLEITSLLDGASQTFHRHNVRRDSAYFNGDAVRVRLWAGPGTSGNSYSVKRVAYANMSPRTGPMGVCASGTDNRVPSNDARVCRLVTKTQFTVEVFGTGFLASAWNCVATAGHAVDGKTSVTAQFNVPLSTSCIGFKHPLPRDQYNWKNDKLFANTGHGNDWGVFTVHRNSDTGLYPAEAQGAYFQLSQVATGSNTMRVTGFGIDNNDPTRCRAQQTATGAFLGIIGNLLKHQVYTLGGSSGSPIIAQSGYVHAVHTGCIGNDRVGTRTTHPAFAAAVSQLCQKPQNADLQPTIMITNANGTMKPGQTYSFQSRIVNNGTVASPATTSGYYLSSDDTITTTDRLMRSFTTIALGPGAKHDSAANIQIPVNLVPGTYYPGVYADRTAAVAELLEQNNSRAGSSVQLLGSPDFVVTSLESSEFFIWPGKKLNLTSKVKNQGTASVGVTQHGFYLSADSTISTLSDALLGFYQTAPMSIGLTRTVTRQVTIPNTNLNGLCYLGTYTDSARQVTERWENNNAETVTAMCGPAPCPDLFVPDLTASTTFFKAGESVTISSKVQNQGNKSSTVTKSRYLLSTDQQASGDDRVLWTFTTAALAQFALIPHSRSVQIPNDVTPGPCYLIVVTDHEDNVAECNENNNTRVLPVTCIGKPDLVVSKLLAPQAATAGQNVAMTIVTRNVGTAAAKSSETGWFLSKDTTITTSDTYLGSHTVPALAAGDDHELVVQVSIPYATDGGVVYLGTLADACSANDELVEANNAKSSKVVMTAYAGADRRLEFVGMRIHTKTGPRNTTSAFFQAETGLQAKMAVVAPQHVGQFYLALWSGSPGSFVFDSWSSLSLSFLNTPAFPNWFGVIPPGGKAYPSIGIPGGVWNQGGKLFVHAVFIDVDVLDGFADNRLRMEIEK